MGEESYNRKAGNPLLEGEKQGVHSEKRGKHNPNLIC